MSQEHFCCDTQVEINDTVINKCWPIRRALVVIIILLHALITINVAGTWSWICFAFIKNGQSFWTVYLNLGEGTPAIYWVTNTTASISTILADLYMVCAIPLRIIYTSLCHFDPRFGAAGWFGGGIGLLFCFQYVP